MPTVERGVEPTVFCSIAIAGLKPLNTFDSRLRHLPQKLTSVRRQTFDISPLSFGVQRIHRERRLAAAARPAEDAHLFARHFKIDALQIVLTRTGDADRWWW